MSKPVGVRTFFSYLWAASNTKIAKRAESAMSLYEDEDDVSGSDAELPSGDDDDGTLEDAAAAEEEHADEGEQSGSSDGEEGQQGAQRKPSRGRKQQEREALVLPGGAAAEGAEQLMVPGNADTALLQLEVRTLLARARSFGMQALGCIPRSSRQSADCLGRLHACTGGCAAGRSARRLQPHGCSAGAVSVKAEESPGCHPGASGASSVTMCLQHQEQTFAL